MSSPNPAQIHRAECFVEKEYRTLRRAMAQFVRASKIVKRANYRLKEPFIAQEIITTNQAAQQSILLKLPAEVQHNIWKHLPTVADRLSLALTCKENAAIFEAIKNIQFGNSIHFLFYKPQRFTKTHRLQVLVRLQNWVPMNFRLCYRCVQYIDMCDPLNDGQWGGSTGVVSDGLATEKAMREGPRCVLCVMADQLEMAKHKETHKKYVNLANRVRLP